MDQNDEIRARTEAAEAMASAVGVNTEQVAEVLQRLGDYLAIHGLRGTVSAAATAPAPIDRLIASLEASTAVNAGLTAALARNAEAMFAVADSHAKLLAALLAPEEPAPGAPVPDERALTEEHTGIFSADGTRIG